VYKQPLAKEESEKEKRRIKREAKKKQMKHGYKEEWVGDVHIQEMGIWYVGDVRHPKSQKREKRERMESKKSSKREG